MQAKPTVNFLVEKTATGYCAYAKDYSILATGATLKKVYQDAADGLAAQCEYLGENPADYTLAFTYDFPTLFEVYDIVNVRALCKRLGMNATLVSQYLNGKKVPSSKQKQRLEDGLHDFARELLQFSFK